MCAAVFCSALPLLRPPAPSGLPRVALSSSRRHSELRLLGGGRSSAEPRRSLALPKAAMSLQGDNFLQDATASVVTSAIALGILRFWGEMARREVFEQKLSRKLVHINVGLVFMLCWPLFSTGHLAPYLAALAPGVNIFRMLLLGFGIWKNEALVKSMSRHGHYRELLKGPLYYACTITLATVVFWRTSPIAISAICNLCAGDGFADIFGRRFGKYKLPYNPSKTFAGSFAMMIAGFLASVGYMHYLASFGFIGESWGMALSFFLVSLATAFVESLPISSELDDNLTVPLTSLFVGAFVF